MPSIRSGDARLLREAPTPAAAKPRAPVLDAAAQWLAAHPVKPKRGRPKHDTAARTLSGEKSRSRRQQIADQLATPAAAWRTRALDGVADVLEADAGHIVGLLHRAGHIADAQLDAACALATAWREIAEGNGTGLPATSATAVLVELRRRGTRVDCGGRAGGQRVRSSV